VKPLHVGFQKTLHSGFGIKPFSKNKSSEQVGLLAAFVKEKVS
jgi:hypothetical protein